MKTLIRAVLPRKKQLRGAAAVEFGLLLPLMIALVAGLVDLGRITYHHNLLNKTVRETGRYLSTQKSGNGIDVGMGANADGTNETSHDMAIQMVRGYLPELKCPSSGTCLRMVIEDAVLREEFSCTATSCGVTASGAGGLQNVAYGGGAFNLVRVTVTDYRMPTVMLGYALGLVGLNSLVVPTVTSTFVQE